VCGDTTRKQMALLSDILLNIGETDITYVGIGSAPYAPTLEEYNDKHNQLLPPFIRTLMEKHKTVSILHFDPMFEQHLPFLKLYLETTFPGIDRREQYYWCMPGFEIRCVPSMFDHENDDWFLESLGTQIMFRGDQLIVQEYTGTNLIRSFKRAYERASHKPLFKKSILYDITYGKDCSCGTDLTKHAPFYDSDGNFLNPLLMTNEEILANIDNMPADRLVPFLIKRFTDALQLHHFNYRRRLYGAVCLYSCEFYAVDAEPTVIMDALQRELKIIVEILTRLNVLKATQIETFQTYMNNYIEYDVYKWVTELSSLMNLTSTSL